MSSTRVTRIGWTEIAVKNEDNRDDVVLEVDGLDYLLSVEAAIMIGMDLVQAAREVRG